MTWVFFRFQNFLSFRFLLFYSMIRQKIKIHLMKSSFFLSFLSLLTVTEWSVSSKKFKEFYAFHSQRQILVCSMVDFNLLHNSKRITFPTRSSLFLYSFCASLLHSLIMWLTVSSLSPLGLVCWVSWHFNLGRSFNVKSCLYECQYTWFLSK